MEQIAWDLAREFARAGHEVTVMTTRTSALPADNLQEGVRILCIGAPSGRYSLAWWRGSARRYRAEFADDCDIMMSVGGGARALGWRARRPGGPGFIVQAHGTSWGEFVSKLRERRLVALLKSPRNLFGMVEDLAYRRFDAFIAVGSIVARDLSRAPTRWLTGAVPVQEIPNGVDSRRFAFDAGARAARRAGLGLADRARVVFSASRLHPQKGVHEAIAAFQIAGASDPDLHFVIAGSGPDEARLRARASAGPTATRIHFIGNIPRDSLRDWLSAADLFLFTTLRVEGLPLNILEALAAGLPVLASEQVADPRFGAVPVDPADAGATGAAILATLAEEGGAERASRLPEIFTLEAAVAAYLGLFARYARPQTHPGRNAGR